MGSLVKKDNQSTQLQKVSDFKKIQLETPEVKEGLSKSEMKVAEASVMQAGKASRSAIRTLTDDQLNSEIGQTLEWMFKDLGLRITDKSEFAYYATRFMKYIKDYYSDLTYKEIEVAFELLHVGTLNEWLPKNSSGQPDKAHYQSFSLDYISKVLNAFKEYKNKVWSKANNLLPEPEKVITPEEKLEYRRTMLNDIHFKFVNYRDKEVEPKFLVTHIVVREFQNAGLYNGEYEPTEEDYQIALRKVSTDSTLTELQKSLIKKNAYEGKREPKVEANVSRTIAEKIIKKVFDDLIEMDMEIKDVLSLNGYNKTEEDG